MKKLAIIGANDAITILINKAKELGYETHVFAWQCGAPGEKAADYFYPISIDKKDEILEKCREIGICGVCSITSDFASPTVSYVARGLGLPANPERTDLVARNKYEMRKAFSEYGGIYTPKFIEADLSFNIADVSNFHFPVIVKPTDRWSSKGITRVEKAEYLKDAVSVAVNESFNKKAIIEEYMEGPEYSAECIVYKGDAKVLAFTKKTTTGNPHYIETGHRQPSDIPINNQEEITEIVKRALKALDIANGAAHAEFRILDDGNIGFMEIGARMGGDCIGTDLTPISTGMDYVRMVIDIACGNEPCFDVVTRPQPVEIRFIISENDIEEFKRIDPSLIIRRSEFDTSFGIEVKDSSARHGYYIIKSENNNERII